MTTSFRSTGATKTEWLRACTGGMSESTFYRVTQKLLDRGLVQNRGGRLHVAPPRDDD